MGDTIVYENTWVSHYVWVIRGGVKGYEGVFEGTRGCLRVRGGV